MKVRFKHYGRKKNKAPKGTLCKIFDESDNLIGEGRAAPISDLPVIVEGNAAVRKAKDKYGKRIKKILATEDSRKIIILKGDRFSYAEGRKYALKNALAATSLSRLTRTNAWHAFFSN